ncbi:MAG: sigma-70 family RNA polymerase sigma factor [Planctomycetaceae bacterium]|nr:sigma-70 family RNA polymerase sigma factor [Planctomycetaceae bacterium]
MRAEWNGDRDPLSALGAGRGDGLFADFVRIETDTFLGFFRRLGAGREEAEDLTQELFVRLYRHAPRYRPSERFAPLCFRVARNAWIDAQRRRAVRPPDAVGAGESSVTGDGRGPGREAGDVAGDAGGGSGGGRGFGAPGRPRGGRSDTPDDEHRDLRELAPDRAAEIGDAAAHVERAVAQLSEGQRAVFELGLVQELPYPEIAAVLDIPVGTVKSRMFHALRRLREFLGDSLGEEDGQPRGDSQPHREAARRSDTADTHASLRPRADGGSTR